MAVCRCSPSLVRLMAAFDKLGHMNSGCCGDLAHQQRVSDHNADSSGYAHAQDIHEKRDHDLQPFINFIMRNPAKFPQVKYLIYERIIYFPHTKPGSRAAGKYAYTGPNAHASHLHVSIYADFTHYGGDWHVDEAYRSAPAPIPKEDLMAKAFVYGNQLTVFSVDGPDIRQRFFDPATGKWTPVPIQIATGVEDGAEIAIVRDYLNDPGRLDLFADGDPGGVVHAWYSPKYGWDREVLT